MQQVGAASFRLHARFAARFGAERVEYRALSAYCAGVREACAKSDGNRGHFNAVKAAGLALRDVAAAKRPPPQTIRLPDDLNSDTIDFANFISDPSSIGKHGECAQVHPVRIMGCLVEDLRKCHCLPYEDNGDQNCVCSKAEFLHGEVTSVNATAGSISVRQADGPTLIIANVDALVVACGAWTSSVLDAVCKETAQNAGRIIGHLYHSVVTQCEEHAALYGGEECLPRSLTEVRTHLTKATCPKPNLEKHLQCVLAGDPYHGVAANTETSSSGVSKLLSNPATSLFMSAFIDGVELHDPELYFRPHEVYTCGCGPDDGEAVTCQPDTVALDPQKLLALYRVAIAASSRNSLLRAYSSCYLPVPERGGAPLVGCLPKTAPTCTQIYVSAGHGCWGVLLAPVTSLYLTSAMGFKMDADWKSLSAEGGLCDWERAQTLMASCFKVHR